MGVLDQVLGSVLRGGGGSVRGGAGGMSPVMKALLFALAAKAAQSYLQQRKSGAAGAGSAGAGSAGGGLGDILGGVLGGGGRAGGGLGGLGGILGGLGGAGGLGVLLDQLTRGGQGEQVRSWVSPGPNQPIAPQALGDALGADTVEELEQHTGLPRDTLLSELAQELPDAVDQITPGGRLPTDADFDESAGG